MDFGPLYSWRVHPSRLVAECTVRRYSPDGGGSLGCWVSLTALLPDCHEVSTFALSGPSLGSSWGQLTMD